MAAGVLEKHEVLEGRQIKAKSLPFSLSITGNAVPASKVVVSDLPGVAILVSQGGSAAPAGVTTVAPDDATGKMSIILDKSAIGEVQKVYEVRVVNLTSTQTVAFSISNGYIVLDLDSAADFSAANAACNIIVTYLNK